MANTKEISIGEAMYNLMDEALDVIYSNIEKYKTDMTIEFEYWRYIAGQADLLLSVKLIDEERHVDIMASINGAIAFRS